VTGGSRGLGAAIASHLAIAGWTVVTCSRNAGDELASGAGQPNVHALRADVGDEDDVARLFDVVCRRLGPPEVLVNNAAIIELAPLADMTRAQWDDVLRVNLTGPFLTTREFARRCATAGCIVNVGSVVARHPTKQQTSYAVAKAGLVGLSRATAVELGPRIRVAHVAVGLADTGFGDVPASVTRMIERTTPNRRVASPDDVARAVAFVVGHEHLGGEALVVDGGLLSSW
jgi:3-oxoacyl-[acyl-carrier protein] reductase